MRMKPVSVKRSSASVNSGFNFGRASKIGRQIRRLIEPINPSKSGSHTMYRFTGALNKFISWKEKQDPASAIRQTGLPFISGFQFNDQADLGSITAIQVSIISTEAGSIEIRLAPFVPTEALHAPFNTNQILFKMILTAANLDNVEAEKLGTSEIIIPYSNEIYQPPAISIPAIIKPDRLILAIMAVQYMVNKKDGLEIVTDLKKLPCGVVWAGIL
jgi:hypothetical protein